MKALLGLGCLAVIGCGSANISGTANVQGNSVQANIPEITSPVPASCIGLTASACPDAATDPTTEIVKDGVVTTIADPTSAFSIASVKELPICCPEKEGALVFIKDIEAFKTCNDNQWAAIDLNGKAGSNGVNGRNIGISIEDVTSTAVCANGGKNYHFYYDNDANKVFSVGDEFFAENPICNGVAGAAAVNGTNGAAGVNGTNGQDARVTYQMICDGTLGNTSASTIWNAKLLASVTVHFEYTETLTGDQMMFGRVINEDGGVENNIYKIFPKNAPTNITYAGMGTGKALYVSKVRILGGNATIGFYPSHGTGGFSTYLQVEENSLDPNIIDHRHTVSGNLVCTAASY